MTQLNPEIMEGILVGERSTAFPSAEELQRIRSILRRVKEAARGISSQEIEILIQFGFLHSAYRALHHQREGFPEELPKFFKQLGLDRLGGAAGTLTDAEVSVYVPCYNGAEFLAATLEGIRSQSYPIAEIIVVDDGSTDGSASIAQKFGATLLTHPKNLGLGAARNSALAHCRTKYIGAIDSDVRPHPLWLERCMAAVTAEKGVVVGGRLIEQHALSIPDAWRARIMRQHHGNKVTHNMLVFGCNSVAEASLLREVGGYGSHFTRSFEDVDITQRILARGFGTRYLPDALCWHARSDSLSSVLETAYGWRTPAFKEKGSFTALSSVFPKWSISVQHDLAEVKFLQAEGRTELMAISFLQTLYSIARDTEELRRCAPQAHVMVRRSTLKLLAYTVGRISRAGENLKRLCLDILGELVERFEVGISPEELQRISERAPVTPRPEEVLKDLPEPLDPASAALLLLSLGELHSILNFEPRIHQGIEAGAALLLSTEADHSLEFYFPGAAPASTEEIKLGSSLSVFDWIEALAGRQRYKVTLHASSHREVEEGYLLLRLLERQPNPRILLQLGEGNQLLRDIAGDYGLAA